MSKNYFITTPIYYVNDVPHIGHAYTTLACDVMARFKRLDGYRVHFLTGTDEHGQKVKKSAQNSGKTPQAFTDDVSQNFRSLTRAMNYSNDDFIRTTEERHKKACQALWQVLLASGDIYLGSYDGWYAVRDEAFYAENELTEGSNGKKIAPSGAECEWVKEESYFFRLSAWQDRLLAYYDQHPDFIMPESRRNEVISFVKSGLRDLSVSRTTFDWGVAVPGDPAHIMYVWLDALTNYITAIGYPDTNSVNFKAFWPADLHMVGKDILRFHAVYWPAFLMAAKLQLPKRIFAHGWWTIEGQKMSKSLGNVIAPASLIETYGLDQTRYFLLREVPFGNDGDFSRTAMANRINGNLANDLGNLCQRVLSMIHKNCDGRVPQPEWLTDVDEKLLTDSENMIAAVRGHLDRQAFHLALDVIWLVVGDGNRYIDNQAPWGLKKTDPVRMNTVLFVLAETIRHLGLVLQAFMPQSAGRILDQLGVGTTDRQLDRVGSVGRLQPGTPISEPQPIFPRFVEEGVQNAVAG